MTSPVLEYKSPSDRRRRWTLFHAWALPLAVAPGAIGSMYWYGDEYGALAGANFPAVLLIQLLPESLRSPFLRGQFILIVLMTLMLLACVGIVMDRLRVPRWAYLLAPPIFLALILLKVFVPGSFPPLRNSIYREWDPDSMCVAWCWSIYLLLHMVPLVLLVRVASSLRRRFRWPQV